MESVVVSIGGGLWRLQNVGSSCRRFYDITRSPFPKGISCNLNCLEFEVFHFYVIDIHSCYKNISILLALYQTK